MGCWNFKSEIIMTTHYYYDTLELSSAWTTMTIYLL